jgi:hypothetical protein
LLAEAQDVTALDARALVSEIRQLLEAATPGPWRWDPHASHPTEMPELLGADDQTVCSFGDREQYYSTEGSAPGDADAALIAAAPRLLTAALGLIEQQQAAMTVLVESSQTAVNFLDSVEWTDTTSEHDAADAQQALEQAIAQAEGETPRDQPQRSRLSDDDVHP